MTDEKTVLDADPEDTQPKPASDDQEATERVQQVQSGSSHSGVETVTAPEEVTGLPLEPGTVLFDNYRIIRLLNKGGMGAVYLAEHLEIKTRHAIKVIKPELLSNEMVRPLTRREATVLSQISSDAVVAYHGFLKDTRGSYYLIMQYVEGPSLKDLMTQKQLSEEEYYVLRGRLLQGLAALHKHQVIHRDLSPDNVILEHGELSQAKLIDLGIAKLVSPDAESTIIGSGFAGKFRYASPEQLSMYKDVELGPASDLYSLGLVLAAALLGKPLDMGVQIHTAIAARMKLPDLSAIPEALRPELAALLEPDPRKRPQNAQAFLTAWPDPADAVPPPPMPIWRTVVLAGIAALVISGGVIYWNWQPDPNTLPSEELVDLFNNAIESRDLPEAESHFRILSDKFPNYLELATMQERLDTLRGQVLEQLRATVNEALAANELDTAQHQLDRLHAIAPGHPALPTLRTRLGQLQAEQVLVSELNELLATDDPTTQALAQGLQLLERLTELNNAHPQLADLEAQLTARVNRRLALLFEATEQALDEHALDESETLLQQIARLLPADDPRLDELEQRQTALHQEQQLLDDLHQAVAEERLVDALRLLRTLQTRGSTHPDLAVLQQQLEGIRESQLMVLLERATTLLGEYQLAAADGVIDELERLVPLGDPELAEIRTLRRQRERELQLKAHIDEALDEGDVTLALRDLEELRALNEHSPRLPQVEDQVLTGLDSEVARLATRANELLGNYRLDEVDGIISAITSLNYRGRHQETRADLIQRLDQARSLVTLAQDIRSAMAAGDALNALGRWQRLRSLEPAYPELDTLWEQLSTLLETEIATLLEQAQAAREQGDLDRLRRLQDQVERLDPDHAALVTIANWIDDISEVAPPPEDNLDELLARFRTALEQQDVQSAGQLLTVLRGNPAATERISALERDLAEVYLATLDARLSDNDYPGFATQLHRYRVFIGRAHNRTALEQAIADREAVLGEQLLAALNRAVDSGDLPVANRLIPLTEDFFPTDDSRIIGAKQGLEIATRLADCRTEQFLNGPHSRRSLRDSVRCFQGILRQHPGNPEAEQAMATIADHYAELVRTLWQQRDTMQAEGALEDLLGFASRYPHLDALLAALPGISFTDPLADGSAGPRMVVISPGETVLKVGDRLVSVNLDRPFAVSRFEISRAEFERFVDAQGGYRTDAENYAAQGRGCFYYDAQGNLITDDVQSNWRNPRFPQEPGHPVVCMTLRDALSYSDWLSTQTARSYRLPTNAEWEYLARSGDQDADFWPAALNGSACQMGNLRDGNGCNDGNTYTVATGRFAASDFGVFDLIGNATEWTCSGAEADLASLTTCLDRDTMRQSLRDQQPALVLARGGSWYDSPSKLAEGDHRVPLPIHFPVNQVGFRVVRELNPGEVVATTVADRNGN